MNKTRILFYINFHVFHEILIIFTEFIRRVCFKGGSGFNPLPPSFCGRTIKRNCSLPLLTIDEKIMMNESSS